MKEQCENKEMPQEVEERWDIPKVHELRGRFNLLLATLKDNLAKHEQLCKCWGKLNDDVSGLTEKIR